MSSSMKLTVLSAAVLTAALWAGAAQAQDANIVEVRQNVMKAQGKDMAAIKGYLDGKNDLTAAQTAGTDLVGEIKKVPTAFPKGTGMDAMPGKSYAKPVIWAEPDKFAAAAKNAAAKAQALDAALKGGNKEAITAAFGDMGKNGCGGCHDTFREKKPS
jgi:cytochrome c556